MPLSRKLTVHLVVFAAFGLAWAQSPARPAATAGIARNECLGYAQHPGLRPDSGPEYKPVPTITFRLEMPSFNPSYYGVAIEADGRAAYQSEPQSQGSAPGDPYMVKFTVSESTAQRIFALARDAEYFQGNFDYKKGKIANTGAKTLSYADVDRCNQTTYNWSENLAIQQLTAIFQNIGTTMEFGHRLAFLHRFDKLGLESELKSMEDMARTDRLAEVQAIAPILQSIASDYAVMNLARIRAQRLLAYVQH